jgi:hypothetical protein
LIPVAVETTFTPPDCSVPPTVIEVGVTATVTVGSVVAAGAAPAEASRAAARRPARIGPLRNTRRLNR